MLFIIHKLPTFFSVSILFLNNILFCFLFFSDTNILHFGVIVCSLGARFKSYCANIVRTFMVNPPQPMQDKYNFLLTVEEEILKVLVAGAKLSDVYESVVSFVRKQQPDLVDKLTKNFGFAMGIEFRESSLSIGPKTTALARKGTVFNVNVGFASLTNKEATDKAGKTYALFIGDTVVVNDVSGLLHLFNAWSHSAFFNVILWNMLSIGSACNYPDPSKKEDQSSWHLFEG